MTIASIGHNSPPNSIEFAIETRQDLSKWLEDHPVIQSEDDARAAKLLADRAAGSLTELERERTRKVKPLNEQVKTINDAYRTPRETLVSVNDLLKERLVEYAKAERDRREKEAADRRLALEAAEKRAREAEEREQEAKEDASEGVVDSGVANATLAADVAFRDYQTAEREAARAQAETHVKIGGGFKRAMSLREKETLTLVSVYSAINEMGLSEDLIEAILKDARAYRKSRGYLPAGVIATTEEVIK